MLKGDIKLDKIRVAQTVSFVQLPKTASEFKPGNHWIPAYIDLPISDNLKGNMKANKVNSESIKGSYTLLATRAMGGIALLLPYNGC